MIMNRVCVNVWKETVLSYFDVISPAGMSRNKEFPMQKHTMKPSRYHRHINCKEASQLKIRETFLRVESLKWDSEEMSFIRNYHR